MKKFINTCIFISIALFTALPTFVFANMTILPIEQYQKPEKYSIKNKLLEIGKIYTNYLVSQEPDFKQDLGNYITKLNDFSKYITIADKNASTLFKEVASIGSGISNYFNRLAFQNQQNKKTNIYIASSTLTPDYHYPENITLYITKDEDTKQSLEMLFEKTQASYIVIDENIWFKVKVPLEGSVYDAPGKLSNAKMLLKVNNTPNIKYIINDNHTTLYAQETLYDTKTKTTTKIMRKIEIESDSLINDLRKKIFTDKDFISATRLLKLNKKYIPSLSSISIKPGDTWLNDIITNNKDNTKDNDNLVPLKRKDIETLQEKCGQKKLLARHGLLSITDNFKDQCINTPYIKTRPSRTQSDLITVKRGNYGALEFYDGTNTEYAERTFIAKNKLTDHIIKDAIDNKKVPIIIWMSYVEDVTQLFTKLPHMSCNYFSIAHQIEVQDNPLLITDTVDFAIIYGYWNDSWNNLWVMIHGFEKYAEPLLIKLTELDDCVDCYMYITLQNKQPTEQEGATQKLNEVGKDEATQVIKHMNYQPLIMNQGIIPRAIK